MMHFMLSYSQRPTHEPSCDLLPPCGQRWYCHTELLLKGYMLYMLLSDFDGKPRFKRGGTDFLIFFHMTVGTQTHRCRERWGIKGRTEQQSFQRGLEEEMDEEARHLRKGLRVLWEAAEAAGGKRSTRKVRETLRANKDNDTVGGDKKKKEKRRACTLIPTEVLLRRSDCNGERSPSWWARNHKTDTNTMEEAFRQKRVLRPKVSAVKSRKCKLLFSLEM